MRDPTPGAHIGSDASDPLLLLVVLLRRVLHLHLLRAAAGARGRRRVHTLEALGHFRLRSAADADSDSSCCGSSQGGRSKGRLVLAVELLLL